MSIYIACILRCRRCFDRTRKVHSVAWGTIGRIRLRLSPPDSLSFFFLLSQGPYDGIIGFSQGGAMASGMIGLQERGLALTGIPALRCLVAIGSFRAGAAHFAPAFQGGPLSCPALLFAGDRDKTVKPSETLALAASFAGCTFVSHPGGHEIPILTGSSAEVADRREAIRDFFEERLSDKLIAAAELRKGGCVPTAEGMPASRPQLGVLRTDGSSRIAQSPTESLVTDDDAVRDREGGVIDEAAAAAIPLSTRDHRPGSKGAGSCRCSLQ